MTRLLHGVLLAALCFATPPLFATPIEYRTRNIDWGAIEETTNAIARTRTALSTSSTAPAILTRTLRLADGHRLRIRERLEKNAQGGEDRVYVGGEKIDELRIVSTDGALDAVLAFLREHDCAVIARYGRTGRIVRARMPETDDAGRAALLDGLTACGAAGAVRPSLSPMKFYQACAQPITPAAEPDDPLYKHEWHLDRIGATDVWADGRFGYPNVKCAVFDTGVHLTHEDLQVNVKTRVSALRSDPSPQDHHGHGSHCLGIMGADANNGKGVTGVGQVANLTSIRGPISYGTAEDDILDGFQYALDNGIRVLSCSFGSPAGTAYYDEAEFEIIEELKRNGCLVVIAAGNDGNDNDRMPGYPASYTNENIIAVVASNKGDRPVNAGDDGWNTSYGATSCDIAAPGTDILSCTREGDSAYEAWEGTSMATPIVAACAAMVWEQNPSWTWREIRDRLLATAEPSSALVGYCATGARVNLAAAMSHRYTIVAEPLTKKAYETGEAVTVRFRASAGVARIVVTLMKRDDESFAKALGTFDAHEGENTLSVWAPGPDDFGRGYILKIEGAGGTAEAHAYTSVFRVKEAGVAETIAVTSPRAGAELDAAQIDIAFTASAAVYADLAIEHRTADGTWELETTLGMVACAPGQQKTSTVQLKGLGWISDAPYRIVVTDNDDPTVRGASEPFYITASSLSVRMEIDGLAGEWEAGVERRVNCYLPQTDLYWLLLIEEESGNAIILKETWTDISDPVYKQWRRFGLTIPESVGRTNELGEAKRFCLRLVDAFDMTMCRDSPAFTLAPRADGRAEPTIAEALGDVAAHDFAANGQWHPERTADGWRLKCGFVGAGENAYFETDVVGPVTVRYDVERNGFPGALKLQRAQAPILKATTWYDVNELVPEGEWRLRWTYARTDNADNPEDEFLCAISNLRFLVTMPHVKISTKNGVLRITGANYPTNVVYTLDGTEPTAQSPQWVDGMNKSPYQFTLDKSMRIRARAFREGTVPGAIAQQDYFHMRGAGTEDDPIRIETPFDLACFAESVLAGNAYVGQTVRLMNDLDMTGVPMRAIGWEGLVGDDGTGYEVVSRTFMGTFDGNGHTIAHARFQTTTLSGYDPMKGLFGCADFDAVIRNITLADANGPILAYEECDAWIEDCKVVSEIPETFDPPPFTPPDYRDYGRPTAISPRLFCNAMPITYPEIFLTDPLSDTLYDRTEANGPWTVRYTIDGDEPTEEDAELPKALVIPGRCTLRAKIFAPPYYGPGPMVTVLFDCDWNEETKAAQTMTIAGGRVVNGAANYTETFAVKANAAPGGMRFSHWKVTGAVAISDYAADPLVFRLMTKEPVRIEAVYKPLVPTLLFFR